MADVKNVYASVVPVTMTLASLASDTNLLAGRSSVVVDNSSNKYLDYLVTGKIVLSGTTPTASRVVELWCWSMLDASVYFDTIDGTDANKTITSRDILSSFMRNVVSFPTPETASLVIPFGPVSVASLWGGVCPPKFGFWAVQSTAQALNAAGHIINVQGVYGSAS